MSQRRHDLLAIILLASSATAYAWWLAGHPPPPPVVDPYGDEVVLERREATWEPVRPQLVGVSATARRHP